jgi:CO/xanthine dehydrogenase Mo-binding subunit
LIPTVLDSPQIIADVVELSGEEAPLGAKGIGEPPINIAPSAIANAVADAIDAPVMQLPITPERVLEALETNLCG